MESEHCRMKWSCLRRGHEEADYKAGEGGLGAAFQVGEWALWRPDCWREAAELEMWAVGGTDSFFLAAVR